MLLISSFLHQRWHFKSWFNKRQFQRDRTRNQACRSRVRPPKVGDFSRICEVASVFSFSTMDSTSSFPCSNPYLLTIYLFVCILYHSLPFAVALLAITSLHLSLQCSHCWTRVVDRWYLWDLAEILQVIWFWHKKLQNYCVFKSCCHTKIGKLCVLAHW